MIRARAAWMREVGHRQWAEWDRNADELAAQVGDPRWPTWVLCDPADGIVGPNAAAHDAPLLGWSEQKRAEDTVFLQSTVTDPCCSGTGWASSSRSGLWTTPRDWDVGGCAAEC